MSQQDSATTGRRVFRKRLSPDCLFEGDLHPNVAERLRKIQELPVARIASLYRAERDDDGDWLVWQFLEGRTLEEFLASATSSSERATVAQHLTTTVQAMHAHGIVHGALHERNVLIDPTGKVYLTHVSPLLWDDEKVDLQALQRLTERLGVEELVAGQPPNQPSEASVEEASIRTRSYLLFTLVLLLGLLSFAGILWYIRGR